MMPIRLSPCHVALLLAIGLTGCGIDEGTLEMRSRAAQEATGLTLPAGARVVFAEQMHGIDDAARIVAIMPVADWKALERRIEATVPDAAPPTGEDVACLGSDAGEWRPTRQPHLTARQVPWRRGVEVLNIGAAPVGAGAGASKVRVFIFWHQT